MGSLAGALIGFLVGLGGFLVMRNPYRLSVLAPSNRSYYQRLVLDTMQRNQLRVLGALVCLFGSGILATACGSLFKSRIVDAIGDALWTVMGLTFVGAFIRGIVIAVKQTIRGELFNWFSMWRAGATLGEIDAFPAITPKMEKEARLFTLVLCSSVLLAIIVGLWVR